MHSWGDWFIFTSNVMGAACQMVGDTQHMINHTLFRHTGECGMLRFFLRCFVCLGKKRIEAVMAQYDTTKGMSPPPLTWNSPAERVCGMSALWQEVMPVNKPWCVRVCLIEKELSSSTCDSPWSLKLHTWLFPLCHHLVHYSLVWNCYQKVPNINGHTVNRSPQSTCNFPHYDLCHNMRQFPPLIIFQSLSF